MGAFLCPGLSTPSEQATLAHGAAPQPSAVHTTQGHRAETGPSSWQQESHQAPPVKAVAQSALLSNMADVSRDEDPPAVLTAGVHVQTHTGVWHV